MLYGTVHSFNAGTGYGFIISDAVEGDVYAHITNVEEAGISRLLPNQSVSFDLGVDNKHRRCATNIKVIK